MALVIILKHRTRLTERALIITARTVLVIIARIIIIERMMIIERIIIIERITIIERMLVASEYKKGGKDRYYRLY